MNIAKQASEECVNRPNKTGYGFNCASVLLFAVRVATTPTYRVHLPVTIAAVPLLYERDINLDHFQKKKKNK